MECSHAVDGDLCGDDFPFKLYVLLEEGDYSLIRWHHHQGFQVPDRDRFVREIAAPQFGCVTWSSFSEVLSAYGFRVTRADELLQDGGSLDVSATIGSGSNGRRSSCSNSIEVFTHPSFRQGDLQSLDDVRFIGARSRTADIGTDTGNIARATPLLLASPPPPAAPPPPSKRKSRPRKKHTAAATRPVRSTTPSDALGNQKATKMSDSSPQPPSAGRRRHSGRKSATTVAAWAGPPCCVACGGETLPRVSCSACGGEYHPRCLDPPMVALPPAEGWVCMLCHHRRRRGRRRHSGDGDGCGLKTACLPSASLISTAVEKEEEEEDKGTGETGPMTTRYSNATALMSLMMARLSTVATANGERFLPPTFAPQNDSVPLSPRKQPLSVGGGAGGGARDMTEQVLAFALETSGKTARVGKGGEPRAICLICERVGEKLATCSSCEFSFHLGCLEPPLQMLPDDHHGGGWVCSMCTEPNSPSEIAALEMSAEMVYRRKRGPPCSACESRVGNVQCCQMCTLPYHPRCMDPPRRGIHTNGFTCADCSPLRPTFEPLLPAHRYPPRQSPRKRRRIRENEAEDITTLTSTSNAGDTTPQAKRPPSRGETIDTPIATPVSLTAEDPSTTSPATSLTLRSPGFTSLDFTTEGDEELRQHRGSRDGSTGSSKSYSSSVCDTETENTLPRDVLGVAERAPTPASCLMSRLPGFSPAGSASGEHEQQRQWSNVEQVQSSNGGGGRCAVGTECKMAEGGKLNTCGECGNSYHSRCLKRPKTRMAGCVWRCDSCREDDIVPPAFLSASHGR